MVVNYIDEIPLYWDNYALMHFCRGRNLSTINEGYKVIAKGFDLKNNEVTLESAEILTDVFDAAIEGGYFQQNMENPHKKGFGVRFITNVKAVALIVKQFQNSLPKISNSEQTEGKKTPSPLTN